MEPRLLFRKRFKYAKQQLPLYVKLMAIRVLLGNLWLPLDEQASQKTRTRKRANFLTVVLVFKVNKMDANAVYDHIQQMRESQPIIWWKAVCYHYVRRTRQITRYRNGDAYTTTQMYYERVNTHVAGSCFSYGACGVKDISKKLVDLEKSATTKIRFSKGFAFANLEAANEFEEQRGRFFHENERHDDYLEMREGLDLVGCNFQEYIVSFANPKRLPWYISHVAFWLLSFLLLSWPLRVLIEYKTTYAHYQITKLFGCSYIPPINRINTVNSIDLIANCIIAPSYSEAVLDARINPIIGNSNANIAPSQSNHSVKGYSSTDSSNRRASILSSFLPTTCSRTSLINGQTVYLVNSLQSNQEGSALNHQTSVCHVDLNSPGSPPRYEDVVLMCEPVTSAALLNFSPLRRSITDKDFFKKLTSQLRRPWGSCHDITTDSSTTEVLL